uniref:BED-type domain-containing protein n=1 Tax=Syphacia muris TaxID=451379 RepID=A0A0N5AQY3_9BILA
MISAESLFGSSFRTDGNVKDEEESSDDVESCNPLKFLAHSMGNAIKEDIKEDESNEDNEDNEGSFNDNNSDVTRKEVADDSADVSNEGSYKNLAEALKVDDGHRGTFDQNAFNAALMRNLLASARGAMECEARTSNAINGAAAAAAAAAALGLNNGNKDNLFNTNSEGVAILPNKKKRQRRNPVWPYFDVSNGIASCKQCSYTTKSVFSTNLKVHLRTHHNDTYKLVIEAEEQQHAALQKSLVVPPPIKQSFGNVPLLPKLPANALSLSMATAAAAGVRDLSLGQILGRMLDITAARESNTTGSKPSTPSAPATPVSPSAETDILESPSTSDYDLTYSTLLNGGRIDEGCLPAINQSPCLSKRRRLRRHPVWRFFKDVDGTKSVGCVKCSFSTASPFSTNLKMHLKAHHKDDYTLVLKLEAQQREEEGIRENNFPVTAGIKRKYSADDIQNELDLNIKKALEPSQPKKKLSLFDVTDEETLMSMSTSERLAAMVELAASNNEEDEKINDQPSNSDSGDALIDASINSLLAMDAAQVNLLARFNLNGTDLLQSSPLLQKNTILSQSLDGQSSRSQDNSRSTKLSSGEVGKACAIKKDSAENNDVANGGSPSPSKSNGSKSDSSDDGLGTGINGENAVLGGLIMQKGFLKPSDSRVAKDEALARFMAKSKAFHFLGMPEFKEFIVSFTEGFLRLPCRFFFIKNFVQTLCPEYQLPSSGSLKRLAETLKM